MTAAIIIVENVKAVAAQHAVQSLPLDDHVMLETMTNCLVSFVITKVASIQQIPKLV